MTKQEFLHQAPPFAAAVIRQAGGWTEFREMAADVCRSGAAAGFGGYCYYSETVPFATRNLSAILDYAREMADDIGEPGAYSFIAGFRCLDGYNTDKVADAIHSKDTEVLNALAWFALEETARVYDDLT